MRGRRKKSGKWQVERERCRIESHRPPPLNKNSDPVSDVVPTIMKKLGLDSVHWLATLEDQWSELVGETVARHSRPGVFDNAVLTVFVDSSVWLSELSRYAKKEMLSNLQQKFGKSKIKDITLRIDPDPR